ncbi:MAG: hypothetical protein IID45_09020 [Planctomycetes bacterium]|nr:hypothetical protein [Planctomycetota bacterium]
MSDSGQGLSFDAGEENLTVLAGHLGEFLDAWGSGGAAPELKEFLPEAEGELRRMTLVELIKIDLEYRLNGDHLPKRLQDYLAEFPELTQGDAGIPAAVGQL